MGHAKLTIDSKADTPRDRSADLEELKATSLIEQRNTLIKAMVKVFSWLNGGVFVLTVVAWGLGFYYQHDQVVTEKVLMALIGATVVRRESPSLRSPGFCFHRRTKLKWCHDAR